MIKTDDKELVDLFKRLHISSVYIKDDNLITVGGSASANAIITRFLNKGVTDLHEWKSYCRNCEDPRKINSTFKCIYTFNAPCLLVPLKLLNGEEVEVSASKIDRLTEYLKIFPQFKHLDKVILFGSALKADCNNDPQIEMTLVYDGDRDDYRSVVRGIWDCLPESNVDNFVGCECDKFDTVKDTGRVIYER